MCQKTTDLVRKWHNRKGYVSTIFLNDMAGAELVIRAIEADDCLGNLLEKSGLEERESKHCAPYTVMEFLGVLFDTTQMIMSVTPDILREIKCLVKNWLKKQKATRKMLESLIGKLPFVAKCVAPGRVFVAQLLDVLRELPPRNPSFILSDELKRD